MPDLFGSKLQFRQEGTGVKTPEPCTAKDEQVVKLRRLADPSVKQEVYRLDF